jgi:hypothetical protein
MLIIRWSVCPQQCLRVRPKAYPRVEHLKDASSEQTPELTANLRVGWKDLPGTNLPAYNKMYKFRIHKVFL